jgi:hypothetical protein
MTERIETAKPVDINAADSPLRRLFGDLGPPLVVDVAVAKGGGLTPDSVLRLKDALEGRLRDKGADPKLVEKLTELFGQAAADPAKLAQMSREGREENEAEYRAALETGIRGALKLLDGLSRTAQRLAHRRACATTVDPLDRALFAYQLGMASGSIQTAMGELGAALETIEHASTCECLNPDDEEPAPAPEAPATPEGA